ncbi:unnamed protein product, partial [Allacma fusca]
GSSPGSFMYLE